jgi:hypothetical protein
VHLTLTYRRLLVIALALLLIVVASVVVSEGVIRSQGATSPAHSQTATTAGMTAAASTASAIPSAATMQFPYFAPAPGPRCDKGAANWVQDNGIAVTCEFNPTRTHLVLTCSSASSANGCGASISLMSGPSRVFSLPSSYTISVDVSGLGSGTAAILSLTPSQTNYAITLYSDGIYIMDHQKNQVGTTVGQGSAIAGTTTRLALRVSGSSVTGIVNGSIVATVPDANLANSGGAVLYLTVGGKSGSHADFANFMITQP